MVARKLSADQVGSILEAIEERALQGQLRRLRKGLPLVSFDDCETIRAKALMQICLDALAEEQEREWAEWLLEKYARLHAE